MKLALATMNSQSLLATSDAFASQALADDPNAGPKPSVRKGDSLPSQRTERSH
ncbi:hypothetical protein [Roseibium sp. RKSG952]|uniref:hypothetical protein n=1 Tax=Roseibium sp. RKSG952 TaxID=2529384 RepID=UPI0018AD1E62|nr:hypothetical protein [Roseibium sp. RKSG952]